MRELLVSRRAARHAESEVHCICRYGRCDKTGPLAVNWATAFRLRQFARGSLWVLPLVGGLLGVLLGSGLIWADRSVHLPPYWTYSPSTASTVLSAIVGAMAALTGFVVTVTVLVVQMATSTFSARHMRLCYRDRMLKILLALLVGTLAYSFTLLRRIQGSFVPDLGVSIAGFLVVADLLLFVVFLDRFLHRLRPVAVAVFVANYVRRDFARYAAALAAPDVFTGVFEPAGEQPAMVVRSARPGAIQALDTRGLAGWAHEHRCLVVLCRRVGDFVPAGAKLIETYGGAASGRRAEGKLRNMVVLGDERTIEQDPAFAIRIMVDIADKALSPAINDPTSAVQALNHLSDVLRLVGTTDLSRSRWQADQAVRLGLVIPVRSWEDYLTLGVTEIREYGSRSIQVMRRMRAMLEELREEVRAAHRPAVEEELARLQTTVARTFTDSVDLDRANTADPQGIGGRTEPPGPSATTRWAAPDSGIPDRSAPDRGREEVMAGLEGRYPHPSERHGPASRRGCASSPCYHVWDKRIRSGPSRPALHLQIRWSGKRDQPVPDVGGPADQAPARTLLATCRGLPAVVRRRTRGDRGLWSARLLSVSV